MHILLVDDSPTDSDLIKRHLCRTPGWHVDVCHSMAAALASPFFSQHDVLLLDQQLPDGNGLDLLIKARQMGSQQTILMLTGMGDEAIAVKALKAGADDYLSKHSNYLDSLPAAVQAAQRRRSAAPNTSHTLTVLYVEHNPQDVDLTQRHLKRHAPHIELEVAASSEACEQRLLTGPSPDVLLLDYRLPGENALDIVHRWQQEKIIDVPIVLITGQGSEEIVSQALRLGVNDYLIKHPAYLFELPSLLERVHRDWALSQSQVQNRRQQLRLRLHAAAFVNSHNGILITDLRRRIISVNPAMCRISGYDEEELIGQVANKFKSGVQGPEFYQHMWQSLLSEGFWEGDIWNTHKNGQVGLFHMSISRIADEQNLPRHYVAVYTDLNQLHQAESELQKLSHYDTLTGLPNRLLFSERLATALSAPPSTDATPAVLLLDLDHFSRINDSLGHQTGNQLLRRVALRLGKQLEGNETLARLGSDEFALLLPASNPKHAEQRGQAFSNALHAPFRLENHVQFVCASMGISLAGLDSDAETLLAQADHALHKAKLIGRQHTAFYHEEDGAQARAYVELENRLRQALAAEEFQVHFQPLAELHSHQVIGAEALLRWHPNQGEGVSPAEFIPILEDNGQIVEVGLWVLEQACAQAQRWLQAGYALQTMAVNLSPIQLRLAPVLEHVTGVLERTGLPPHVLELEVTESGLVEHSEETLDMLNQLRQLGVRIAVDDFGTGYSSLAYLSRLPLDKLKIDRSFVSALQQSPRDRNIVRAIIALAKSLNLHVLAEGVETAEQASALHTLGTEYYQGYLLSPALPGEAFAQRFFSAAP